MSEQPRLDAPARDAVPAYRSVARSISEQILNGSLPLGSPLPAESTLAQTLGINRSTVREAIRVLEDSGMLRRRPGGKRLFVSAPRHAEVASRMKAAMVLQEMSFLELWEAMICIEPAVTAAAAVRITESELNALDDNVARTRHAVAHAEDLVALDVEFHNILAAASRSRTLVLCREPIGQVFYPAFLQLVLRLNVGERLAFAHQQVVDGLRARDIAKARLWMEKHIVDFRRGYELANLDISQPITWAGDA